MENPPQHFSQNNKELNLDSYLTFPDSTDQTKPDSSLIIPDSTKNLLSDSTKISSNLKDSTKVKVNQDSLRLVQMSLDSTARVQYFKYQREELPVVTLQQTKQSKFFVQPSPSFKSRDIRIDSTGKYVEITEKVAGKPNKIILRMPIEEYLQERLKAEERRKWEEIGYKYELKSDKVEFGQLIKNITDFEIPLPSVGVLSIFGTPKISLKIGGSVQIHGAWRSETTEGVTASRLGNTRNEPDFKQQVQINVNGTIGDKLNIVADWNTERTFEYENQLKIKYTGYEDEIIQSIEAGNVSLQTSPLVGGGEALFGIKAQFKMGPFSLTTIASQKKGETKEVEVSGGTTETPFQKRAYEYSTNHYFVDTVYADTSASLNMFNNYYGKPTPQVNSFYFITDFQVWKSIQVISPDRSKERDANAYIDLPPQPPGGYDDTFRGDIESPTPGRQETGRFLLLDPGVDYTFHPETGFITFKTAINTDDIIAVSFRQDGFTPAASDDIVYGEFLAPGDTNTTRKLVLKLVKPRNLQPQFATAWSLQLKNIYPTGLRNIKEEGFDFQIKYEVEGQEPLDEYQTPNGTVRFLNIFGLDLLDASKQSNPDNVFDFRPNITVFPETGEIIFPYLEPFGRNIPPPLDALKYQDVYDTTKTFAQQNKVKDKWLLIGKSTGTSSSVYQLGFNVVENSVKVLLDGRELTPGVDYTVDYNIGQLTIRNDAALVPGANLRITFEQNDLFQLASKTLLGARGMYEFSKKTKLGFSVLNLNQQTLSDKVRIGEEPLSNTIYGVDFTTTGDLPILTKLTDFLFPTREMSNFNLTGEYAYINPDPNTKKSTISSDGGKSIAYIDDFEGAKRIIPIGVSYTSWKDLSPPDSIPSLRNIQKRDKIFKKAKSFWFTRTPSDVTVDQIYGDRKQVARSDQQVTVMDYVFLPDTPGTYNYASTIQDPTEAYGGVMKILSSTANNLIEENVEFIEFWMNVVDAPQDAKLYLDLGKISEDVIPNNLLDTEDKDRNDAIDVQGLEDTGLDGLFDDGERAAYGSNKVDPSGDNFIFAGGSQESSIFDFYNINGTQGNAVLTDVGRIPDTEDLNRNGNLDLINSYFRYEIPLDTSVANNPFIQSEPLAPFGWYLFRIPLKDFQREVGSPSLSNVEFIRLFTTNVANMVHFRITEFNLIGSQWQKVLQNDSVLSISVVSREENLNYTSPPGVFPERDRTRPDEEIYRNEQALNLIIKDLPDGEKREAVKYLFRPLDVFNYKEMKLFVHGDEFAPLGNLAYNDTASGQYSAEAYFRFGGDTNNYYEYRQPILPGWNEITINFEQLTAIKQARTSVSDSIVKIPVPGKTGHFYELKGNPSLTSVKFLSVGIFNKNDGFNPGNLYGEVWVNELRVVGADDSPGWAYNASASVKVADLLNVSFNLSQKNPYFHKIADRFGSRIENQNWSFATDLNVLKMLPFNLPESNLKINYAHTEQIGKPLYIPGTDVKVDRAVEAQKLIYDQDTTGMVKSPDQIREETETQTISDSWSASNVKIVIPTDWWLIRDTFNKLSYGFNYNKSFNRSPTVMESKNWIWNANTNYGLTLNPNYNFELADLPAIGWLFGLFSDYSGTKIYYLPQSFSLNATAKRNKNSSISRPRVNPQTGELTEPNEVVSRDFVTTRGFNYNWKLTEGGFFNLSHAYNVNVSSSLAYLETDVNGMQRSEKEIWSDIFNGAGFGRDYRYQQTLDFRTSPKLPSFLNLQKYINLTAGYSVGYQWNYDFRQPDVGRSAGFSNKLNLGLTFRLKSIMDPLFASEENTNTKVKQQLNRERQRTNTRTTKLDSLGNPIIVDSLMQDSTLAIGEEKPSALKRALGFLVATVKTIFFDYESIVFNFTNDNSLSKSGIKGTGTGFSNFWGVSYNPDNGPGRLFMLGLSEDVGPRVSLPGTNLNDIYSQKNNFEFKTARPLWEGAKIDINWKVNWSLNKTSTISTDNDGNLFVSSISSSGNLSRSFLSLPFSSVGITKVAELYNPSSTDPTSLSDAFVQGFETFPWLSRLPALKEFSDYIPRPNWRITWDGLEKIVFFKSIADRVSLDHAYTSSYTEGWKLSREGKEETQIQKIEYGFSPLAGLNITFGQLWGGNFSGNLKYSTRSTYDLGVTTANITETLSKDIGFTLQYSKSGFELPLFGVSLKNDIEFSLAYSSTRNSTIRFDMRNFTEEGTPQDGNTRVTIEPRIKYTISAKVTLSIFYKRSTVEPEGASRIPPTTTNEAGLDVNITIN